MAYWRLTTYTRPDTSKEFYIRRTVAEVKTASVIGAKIVEFENSKNKNGFWYRSVL